MGDDIPLHDDVTPPPLDPLPLEERLDVVELGPGRLVARSADDPSERRAIRMLLLIALFVVAGGGTGVLQGLGVLDIGRGPGWGRLFMGSVGVAFGATMVFVAVARTVSRTELVVTAAGAKLTKKGLLSTDYADAPRAASDALAVGLEQVRADDPRGPAVAVMIFLEEPVGAFSLVREYFRPSDLPADMQTPLPAPEARGTSLVDATLLVAERAEELADRLRLPVRAPRERD